jgi:S-DNA-T family DNA segregation ATPase FtsK/SpoIIIE
MKKGAAASGVLLKKVSENLQELVAGTSKGPRISIDNHVDGPTPQFAHENTPSAPDRGGLATLLAAGRQLALAGKSKIGSSGQDRIGDERFGPMFSSSSSASEETAVSMLRGPAEEKGLEEVQGPRKFRFRLLSGDKSPEEAREAPRLGEINSSVASPRRMAVQKKPRGGIRIGRRKAQTLAPGAPVVMPSMETAPPEIEVLASIEKTAPHSPESIPPPAEVPETPSSGIRVRHAGLEGEAEIVRIEDDSIVADMDVPEVNKSNLRRRSRYAAPSLDLFADAKSGALVIDEEAIREKSELLEKTLQEFGVEGHVTEVKTGPVITIYEFVPAAGVKVSKISSLSDDLARALSAINVRIVAPIPGTSAVGIEIPNEKRRTVHIKEILSSREFSQAQDRLTLGIGKDILGRTAFTDLAKIPHLLIAGATGAGKSVALNMMICSLLVRCMPREVRLVMIDPKMLEFSIYEGIPHLLAPIITSPKKASSALRGVVAEMESRYTRMSTLGVRNIESYNRRVADRLGPKETNRRLSQHLSEEEAGEGEMDFMPYIVVVIDELADLMMVSSRDVEENMTRLAQMARAAGIHLLVATQRPSVDVLTGLIKANFPSRLSLRVASRTDSRTILDMNGAERLLGKGDMLFIPPGTSTPTRIHGAYVSEQEIRNLVNHWRDQGTTAFQEDIFVEADSRSDETNGEGEYDERYDDAVGLVGRTGEASISLIQRHLRIGYNRAARMIERMEQEGIVGPSDGVKRRQVLIRNIPDNDVEAAEAN